MLIGQDYLFSPDKTVQEVLMALIEHGLNDQIIRPELDAKIVFSYIDMIALEIIRTLVNPPTCIVYKSRRVIFF